MWWYYPWRCVHIWAHTPGIIIPHMDTPPGILHIWGDIIPGVCAHIWGNRQHGHGICGGRGEGASTTTSNPLIPILPFLVNLKYTIYRMMWYLKCIIYRMMWYIKCTIYRMMWYLKCTIYRMMWYLKCTIYRMMWYLKCTIYRMKWYLKCTIYRMMWYLKVEWYCLHPEDYFYRDCY